MPCCTKIMWVMCKPKMPPWVVVLQVGVTVSVWVTGIWKLSDLGRKEENRVGKPGQESCIYFTAIDDTLMSNITFTWKVKWETESDCLLLSSKNNIWSNPAALITQLHIMFTCKNVNVFLGPYGFPLLLIPQHLQFSCKVRGINLYLCSHRKKSIFCF